MPRQRPQLGASSWIVLALVLLLASMAMSTPSTSPGDIVVIRNGTVVPVTSPTIPDGVVVIEDGRIRAVGTADSVTIPDGARIIDAERGWVLPGLVIARSTLGLQGARGNDVDEDTGPLQPELETFFAIDPFHPDMTLVRDEGVTTVNVTPGDAALVGGRGTVIKTDGDLIDEMVVRRRSCMILSLQGSWSHLPFASSPQQKDPIATVRDLFDLANRADSVPSLEEEVGVDVSRTLRKEGFSELLDGRPLTRQDPQVAAILPVLRQRIPLIVRCERRRDILAAVRLSERYGIRVVLHGAADAIDLVPMLKEHGIGIIAGPLHPGGRQGEEPTRTPQGVAALVHAGLQVALVADESSPYRSASLRFLWLDAASLSTTGLSLQQCLAPLTIEPARLLGIEDRVGSLEPGKDGDIVIFSGHPFATSSLPRRVLIEGREVKRPE
ncbi:MAG: amidohydrolase family protein [Planctomycetota bacterium]